MAKLKQYQLIIGAPEKPAIGWSETGCLFNYPRKGKQAHDQGFV